MRQLSRDRLLAILLLSPSVIAIAVFVYGFIGFTGYSSLSKWDALEPDFTFVGLRNYAKLFTIDRFLCDLRNTVTFTVLFLAACLVIGLLLAILLDQKVKGEGIFRGIFLFPMAISYIVTGVAWRWRSLRSGGQPRSWSGCRWSAWRLRSMAGRPRSRGWPG